jgi:hypothetical protein
MDPDHSDGFGGLFRRDKKRTPIDDVIRRPNIDKLFGELSWFHGFGARRSRLPKSKSCPQHPEENGYHCKLTS